jgi:hypothetical protein
MLKEHTEKESKTMREDARQEVHTLKKKLRGLERVNAMLFETLHEAKALLSDVIAEMTHAAVEAREVEEAIISEHRRSVSKEAALALQLQLAREQDEETLLSLESKKKALDQKTRQVEDLVAEKLQQQQSLRNMIQEADEEASKLRDRMSSKEHELDAMAKSFQAVVSDLEAERGRERQVEKERVVLTQVKEQLERAYEDSELKLVAQQKTHEEHRKRDIEARNQRGLQKASRSALRFQHLKLAAAFDLLLELTSRAKTRREVGQRAVMKLMHSRNAAAFGSWHGVTAKLNKRREMSEMGARLQCAQLAWAFDRLRASTQQEHEAAVLQMRLNDALRVGQEVGLACTRAQEEAESAKREAECMRLLVEQESVKDKESAHVLLLQIHQARQEAQDAKFECEKVRQEADDDKAKAQAQIESLVLLVEETEKEMESEKDNLLEQFERENRRAAEMSAMVQKLCMEKEQKEASDANQKMVVETAWTQERELRERVQRELEAKEQELTREREPRETSVHVQGRDLGAAANLAEELSGRIEELERHNDDLLAANHLLQQQIVAASDQGRAPSCAASAALDVSALDEALSAALQQAEKAAAEKEHLRQELDAILSSLVALSLGNDAWLLQHSPGSTQPALLADQEVYVKLGLPPKGRTSQRVVRTPIQCQEHRYRMSMMSSLQADDSTVVLGSVIKGDLVPVSSAYKQPRALITPPSSRGSSLGSCGMDQLVCTPSSRRH